MGKNARKIAVSPLHLEMGPTNTDTGMIMAAEARNHRWIPQCYLKGGAKRGHKLNLIALFTVRNPRMGQNARQFGTHHERY